MDLPALLGELTPEHIAATLAERKWLHAPRLLAGAGSADKPPLPFGWPEFVEALNLYDLRSRDIRVTKGGEQINPILLQSATGTDRIDGAAFANLARQGISVVLNYLELRLPVMDDLRRSAERTFGMPATIACIASFGKGGAFKPHHDHEDILVFQVEGMKEWDIVGHPLTPPPSDTSTFRLPSTAVTASFTMRPGDALVVPSGQGHCCRCIEPSLHLGIILEKPVASAYLSWLLSKAEADPRFRPGPPVGPAPEAQARFDAELEALVGGLLAAHPPAAWRAHLARRAKEGPVVLDGLPIHPRHDGGP